MNKTSFSQHAHHQPQCPLPPPPSSTPVPAAATRHHYHQSSTQIAEKVKQEPKKVAMGGMGLGLVFLVLVAFFGVGFTNMLELVGTTTLNSSVSSDPSIVRGSALHAQR